MIPRLPVDETVIVRLHNHQSVRQILGVPIHLPMLPLENVNVTPHQAQLIRESFAHLHRRQAESAELFYGRLFEIAPETRALFKTDIRSQGVKLMESLTVAIASLNDRPGLTALLKKLGRNHRGYGVEAKHYACVGEALIWTLQNSLGKEFTAETRLAWEILYGDISGVMIKAQEAVS
jgi:hemoglobin-like flavoprotein